VPFVPFVPYVFLSAFIVSLWLTRGFSRYAAVAAFLTLAIGSGFVAGVVSPPAGHTIIVYVALCQAYGLRLANAMRVPLAIAVVLASLGLMAHVVPGFSNVLIVKDAIVSRDGVPFTLYFNFDKALIGVMLLTFVTPLAMSRADWFGIFPAALPRILAVIAVVLGAAFALGFIRVDPKWPPFFPLWAWANLLFTCTAEEAVFRGVIQRMLAASAAEGNDRRAIVALLIAGVLFGAVHFAGGPRLIVMASIAGAGYGWVYWRSGYRIEASILAHFLLNVTHILFFTYPALAVPGAVR
jgi:membrane protease YdiL (CAAX protease family)